MTDPHLDDCECGICVELHELEAEQVRLLLRSCMRMHAPPQLRAKIVVEVRKVALTWNTSTDEDQWDCNATSQDPRVD